MALKLVTPIVHEFFLDKSDKKYGDSESRTVVRFTQATQGSVELHEAIFSSTDKTYYGAGGVRVSNQKPQAYLKKMEVFSTMTYCDVQDANGNMIFTFEKGKLQNEKAFFDAWALLPPDIADEIHECCLVANPQWSASGEA